ncbi:uncharacterized protein LOC143269163 isoform X3 [Peromyscus maniculatus bairdii]|uniref:uncharacterized protein LOC143269163 isoform X3 n=1 Tax=Peromyscus maniculatus bairdii TaxID=230844 RepID=UPI003FD2F851
MATYPPRRLLGAGPLPSDPRRDPRRGDSASLSGRGQEGGRARERASAALAGRDPGGCRPSARRWTKARGKKQEEIKAYCEIKCDFALVLKETGKFKKEGCGPMWLLPHQFLPAFLLSLPLKLTSTAIRVQ